MSVEGGLVLARDALVLSAAGEGRGLVMVHGQYDRIHKDDWRVCWE